MHGAPPQTVEETIYQFLVNDFVGAWDAVARDPGAPGRGNFIFGRHVMALLEWIARLCWADPSGAPLRACSTALHQLEPRYFTLLPGPCADTTDFELPGMQVPQPQAQLLWVIFDLVRHGLGHQNLPVGVVLPAGGEFGFGLSGAQHSFDLATCAQMGPGIHLAIRRDGPRLSMALRPDVLFAHLRQVVDSVNLLQRGLQFPYLLRPSAPTRRRPRYQGNRYCFTVDELEQCLVAGGHHRY